MHEFSVQPTTILESIPAVFFTLDRQGRCTYLNEEAERFFQRPRAELLGRVLWEQFKDVAKSPLENTCQQVARENRPVSFEEFYPSLNLWAEVDIYPSVDGVVVLFSKIAESRFADAAVRECTERLKLVVNVATDAIWDWDVKSGKLWWSEGAYALFGYAPVNFEMGSKSWRAHIHPEDRERVLRGIHAAMNGSDNNWSSEYRLLRKDGSLSYILERGFLVRNQKGDVVRMCGAMIDITERKRAELERSKVEARIRDQAALLDKAHDAIIVTGRDLRITYWNKSAERLFGWTSDEILGKSKLKILNDDPGYFSDALETVLHKGDWRGEFQKRHKDGHLITVQTHWTLVLDDEGKPQSILCIDADISQRKAAEREIEQLAFFDPLTGLPNRRLLMNRLQQALASTTRTARQGALLYIDLDNFKSLNDTLGHDKGDLLLQQVAQRLNVCTPRKSDTVARLGGDEFIVLLEDLSEDQQEAAHQVDIVAEKILDVFQQPFDLSGRAYHTTPSIGITLIRDHANTIEELLKQADLAMYQAKAAGRNILRFFDPAMQTAVAYRVALETDLRHGLQQHEFMLHYQRQTDANGHTIGAEALVRWHHPQRGLVSPAQFIPLAEESGLILRLGYWILETACRQLALWAEKPETSHLTVAVNVSARQFHHPDFVDQMLVVLQNTGANPKNLKLELTESLLVENVEDVIAKMIALKATGVTFALDDFGTGYSSLSYLKRLPLDQLKIDQSFVKDIISDAGNAAIALAIVNLGQTLGLQVIAEGVETEDQRTFLANHGCHAYQGYLISRPLPAEQF